MALFRKLPKIDGPHCATCGYCMIGNVSGRCPECGDEFDPSSRDATPRRRSLLRGLCYVVSALGIGLLALWSIAPTLNGPRGAASARIAKAAVGRSGPVAKALGAFRMDVGRFPRTSEGLAALFVRPDGLVAEWKGPYMEGTLVELVDPWGSPFQYIQPGIRNRDGYDLWSAGPDRVNQVGVSGTDDIVNWVR